MASSILFMFMVIVASGFASPLDFYITLIGYSNQTLRTRGDEGRQKVFEYLGINVSEVEAGNEEIDIFNAIQAFVTNMTNNGTITVQTTSGFNITLYGPSPTRVPRDPYKEYEESIKRFRDSVFDDEVILQMIQAFVLNRTDKGSVTIKTNYGINITVYGLDYNEEDILKRIRAFFLNPTNKGSATVQTSSGINITIYGLDNEAVILERIKDYIVKYNGSLTVRTNSGFNITVDGLKPTPSGTTAGSAGSGGGLKGLLRRIQNADRGIPDERPARNNIFDFLTIILPYIIYLEDALGQDPYNNTDMILGFPPLRLQN